MLKSLTSIGKSLSKRRWTRTMMLDSKAPSTLSSAWSICLACVRPSTSSPAPKKKEKRLGCRSVEGSSPGLHPQNFPKQKKERQENHLCSVSRGQKLLSYLPHPLTNLLKAHGLHKALTVNKAKLLTNGKLGLTGAGTIDRLEM